jgi:bifunctional DNase/RNase
MAQVAVTIDAVRRGTLRDAWALILKERVAEEYPAIERYLPIWISPPQADIIIGELLQRPDKSTTPDVFSASINATEFEIECVTIHLGGETFYAWLQLCHYDEVREVKCPIAVAVALASRTGASILVNEATWDKAALTVNRDWTLGVGDLVPTTGKTG